VFDLPDDAICASGAGAKRVDLGVEPVEWTWLDGDASLAWGGVAGDRPSMTLAVGAAPAVDVGEPIAGPSEAKKVVLTKRAELTACYAEELQRTPALDGLVVVDLGARISISADSTGSAALARCVEQALAPLAGGTAASVPIRFELAAPAEAPAVPASADPAPGARGD
jgi:hypothetical protein